MTKRQQETAMRLIASKQENKVEIYHVSGYVIEALEQTWVLQVDDDLIEARRALSCLVEPEPGDRVLAAVSTDGEAFLLAVLERPETSDIHIRVEGDLKLGAASGRISVSSAQGMDFLTPNDIAMTATDMELNAKQASVSFATLSYLGQQALAQLQKVKLVGGLWESVMEHVFQRTRTSHRIVDDMEQLRSGQLDYRASKNMNLRGKNTLMTAEELVKVDGGQIHLG
jgi:hypothetical protein